MKICNLSHLKAFLSEHGLQAKKRSSQNFLVDGNIVRNIRALASLTPEDFVLEIGPGPGALTEALLETGCTVLAVERDTHLATLLRRLCPDERRLRIFSEDFLTLPLESLLQSILPEGKKIKVVANLPYHITTPILTKLLPLTSLISDVIVMVQKEVAERCVAKVGETDYSCLTLFLQFYAEVEYAFTVEPTCFYPKPSVRSSVLRCKLKAPPAVDKEAFFTIVHTAFQKRRKMLKSSLRSLFTSSLLEEALAQQNINPQARPEELSLSQFLALTNYLEPYLP